MTEARSGTDVADMDTSYAREDDGYVIRGSKMWISFLDVAAYFLTFAHDGVDERGRKRVSAFIVERDAPGLEMRPVTNKYGFRPLSTGELVLNDVTVPLDALVGEEGRGMAVALNAVENGRLGVAARSVGLAQACVDAAVPYARSRVVFKQEIGRFQMVQEMLSDMICGVEAARLLTYRLAHLKDAGARAAPTPRSRRCTPPTSRWTRPRRPSRSTAPTGSATSTRCSATCGTRRSSRSSRATTSSTRR